MADLYIIAAGHGSRLGANVPKPLVEIDGEPCITRTLKILGKKFNKIFIVANDLAREHWNSYSNCTYDNPKGNLPDNVHILYITSGLGDGHATFQGLKAAKNVSNRCEFALSSDIVITWGDVFFAQPEIIDELLNQPNMFSGFIPAVHEQNPYVTLLVDENMFCLSADFSKYGENHPHGFHDQSVFRFDYIELWNALTELHRAFWKNGRYVTPGGELSLLHTFHYFYNKNTPLLVYSTDYKTQSFNTLAELEAIRNTRK